MPYWWWYRYGRRAQYAPVRFCFFGHNWRIKRIDRHQFRAAEYCTRCGKERRVQLLPEHEHKVERERELNLYKDKRDRLFRELKYEIASGTAANNERRKSLAAQIKSLRPPKD